MIHCLLLTLVLANTYSTICCRGALVCWKATRAFSSRINFNSCLVATTLLCWRCVLLYLIHNNWFQSDVDWLLQDGQIQHQGTYAELSAAGVDFAELADLSKSNKEEDDAAAVTVPVLDAHDPDDDAPLVDLNIDVSDVWNILFYFIILCFRVFHYWHWHKYIFIIVVDLQKIHKKLTIARHDSEADIDRKVDLALSLEG